MQNPKNLNYDNTEQFKPEIPLGSAEDVKQWEEARCPICMEHPHNAVLLRCFSYENGCRPFMCNTSYRHSNCLDQFCKISESSPSTLTIEGIPSARANPHVTGRIDINESESWHKLACPLCRGEIYGWFVVDAARKYMNSKARSCSCENCDFSGNYLELRKHARSDHPMVRPLEVDPERQRNWERMEREIDISDLRDLITWMSGEREEEDTELEITSLPDSDEFLYIYSIIQFLHETMLPVANYMERMNAILLDGDDHLLEMIPRIRNNYRRNNTRINLNSGQNDLRINIIPRTPGNQNDHNRNNTSINTYSRHAGNFRGRSASNETNYRENSTSDNFNSRYNNRLGTNLVERSLRNQNEYRENSTSDNFNPTHNNSSFRTNHMERNLRTLLNYSRNRLSNNPNENNYRRNNSRQSNTNSGSSIAESMRQRRISDIRQSNNANRRSRLDGRRSRHDIV